MKRLIHLALLLTLSLPVMAQITLAPSQGINVNHPANTITVLGTGTSWTAGTPGSPTFTLIGGTGASIVSQTVTDSSHAVLTVDAGSGTGTLTISDGTYTATEAVRTPVTWYADPIGGTRYSPTATSGQCDGQADVAYPGTGTNQHCAFNDVRYMWDDQSYGGVNFNNMAMAGGDTFVVIGSAYNANQPSNVSPESRIGFDNNTGSGAGYTWCLGGTGPYDCFNRPFPSGTSSEHTKVYGKCVGDGNCSSAGVTVKANLTQLFGGFGVAAVLNLGGASYVDVQGFDITSHSTCITHGSPAVPVGCHTSFDSSMSDYDSNGILTDVNTSNVTMTDMWVHGNTNRGIIGPFSDSLTCTRCDIYANGMAGWDFDDGLTHAWGTDGHWYFIDSTIEWNGCNSIYPSTTVNTCYSQSTGGYGDGVATQTGGCFAATIQNSHFNYNTQDGLDLGHFDTGACPVDIETSTAYGNNAGTFKVGGNGYPLTIKNNTLVANGDRLTELVTGITDAGFNTNLADYLRAGDAMAFNFRNGQTADVENNTLVSYFPTSYDVDCWDSGTTGCPDSVLNFKNNITLGYDNPTTYTQGGNPGGVGGFYFQHDVPITRSYSLWYGMRSTAFTCPTGYTGEQCISPALVDQPTGNAGTFTETELDDFNFVPTGGSPAVQAGNYALPLDRHLWQPADLAMHGRRGCSKRHSNCSSADLQPYQWNHFK